MLHRRLDRIRARVAGIMEQEERAPFFSFEAVLLVLSVGFGAVLKLRGWLFQKGIFKTRVLPCKVISIGNLAVGGTGKTPMTVYVAELVQRLGYRPVVISRGYKGGAEKSGGLVSDGETLLMTADMAGDEPVMMAETMKRVPVLVGRNRYEVGLWAVEKFSPDVIVFDDAFQHLKLARDLDLVLLDNTRPLGNGHLLPRGILRERPSALARATALIRTRVDESPDQIPGRRQGPQPVQQPERLKAAIAGKPVFTARHMPYVWQRSATDPLPESALFQKCERLQSGQLQNRRVYAFSGIARNRDFRESAIRFGCHLSGYAEFPDHHPYTAGEVEQICRSAQEAGAEALVTTEKDFARIAHRFSWPMHLLIVGIEISFVPDDDAFDDFIQLQLSRLP